VNTCVSVHRAVRGGLRLAAAAFPALAVACAHGPPRVDDPSPAAAQACAGVAPMSVLAGGSGPETAVTRGQALYCLALYEPALSVLTDQAIGKPAPDPPPLAADRLPALRWLVYIHRRFPGWERINAAIGMVARTDLERPELADVRDDLHALAARFAYKRGSFDQALELLGRIPPSSPLRARALLLEGAIHVRRAAMDSALAAFAGALRIAPAGADRDLAVISLARVSYATGQLDTASRTYDRLPPPSPYWAAAALEGAWTSFRLKDHPRALARLRTLAARPGEVPVETMAEALTLEATIALEGCRREDYERALGRFNGTYPDLFTQARRHALEALDAGMMRQLRAETPVARRFEEVAELEHERTLYETLPAGWRASTQGLAADGELTVRGSAARREADEQLQLELKRVADALATQIKKSIKLEYELLSWEPGVPSDQDGWSLCEASRSR
jgi:tetratricopeptide (TPR) repeat protein